MGIVTRPQPYDCAKCGKAEKFHQTGGAKLSYLVIDKSAHDFETPSSELVKERMRKNFASDRESAARVMQPGTYPVRVMDMENTMV